MIVTHVPSGMVISSKCFKFKEHDRPEDIERKIKKSLDDSWIFLIENAQKARGSEWRWH